METNKTVDEAGDAATEVSIRRFLPADLNRVFEIEEASFPTDLLTRRQLLRARRHCSDLFFVAELGGALVGYILTCKAVYKAGAKAHILFAAVDPIYRKRGVARALAQYTLALLQGTAIKIVEIETRVSNRAIRHLAASLGFVSCETRPGFYSDGESAIVMRKYLDGSALS